MALDCQTSKPAKKTARVVQGQTFFEVRSNPQKPALARRNPHLPAETRTYPQKPATSRRNPHSADHSRSFQMNNFISKLTVVAHILAMLDQPKCFATSF